MQALPRQRLFRSRATREPYSKMSLSRRSSFSLPLARPRPHAVTRSRALQRRIKSPADTCLCQPGPPTHTCSRGPSSRSHHGHRAATVPLPYHLNHSRDWCSQRRKICLLASWAAQRAEDDTVHAFSPPNHKITTRWRGSSTMITCRHHL